MLVDRFNRQHDYLRISLTNNCNLRCTYCMPEEEYEHTPAAALMQAGEIVSLATTFAAMGVRKIRLTGGEPLVRKDAANIIRALSALPVSLSLTTNGTRLAPFLPVLQEAGVNTINISLDTLHPDKYLLLTRRDQFHTVRNNIRLLLQHGINVKINVVVMKGVNEMEMADFVAWTKDTPLNIRFIEFMPFTGNRWSSNKVFTHTTMLASLANTYKIVAVSGGAHDTARHYRVPGHAGYFSIISSMSAPFCGTCNRMRLTADGKMKNCLFSGGETDLLQALRSGEDVQRLIIDNLQQKARERGGQFENDFAATNTAQLINRSMIAIGG